MVRALYGRREEFHHKDKKGTKKRDTKKTKGKYGRTDS
jgi:hypothetical protein